MTNTYSQVTIKVPEVPEDFEARAGTTKTDLAEAILKLIQGAQLNGVNLDSPDNFDLNEINNRLNKVEADAASAKLQQRLVVVSGINNGLITVPFAEMPSASYKADVVLITANVNINTVTWSLIENSKTPSQCQFRIDGTAAPYKIEVSILEVK